MTYQEWAVRQIASEIGWDGITFKNNEMYFEIISLYLDKLPVDLQKAIKASSMMECTIPQHQPNAILIADYGFPVIIMSSTFNELIRHNSRLVDIIDNKVKLDTGPTIYESDAALIEDIHLKIAGFFFLFCGNSKFPQEFVWANIISLSTLYASDFYNKDINAFVEAHKSLKIPEEAEIKKFLGQILFLMLHEFGHYVLEHSPTKSSAMNTISGRSKRMKNSGFARQNELDADSYAIQIIIDLYRDTIKLSDVVDIFLLMSCLDSFSGDNSSHPTSCDRIQNILNLFKTNITSEEVEYISKIINYIHLHSQRFTKVHLTTMLETKLQLHYYAKYIVWSAYDGEDNTIRLANPIDNIDKLRKINHIVDGMYALSRKYEINATSCHD